MKFDKNFWKDWLVDWRVYIAEFLATYIFVLICSFAVVVDYLHGQISTVGISFIVGSVYAALIFATNHISGGYLNPAITFSLWLSSKIKGTRTVFLILAQLAASFLAFYTTSIIFGKDAIVVKLGAPTLGIGETIAQATGIEAIMSAILVFCVFAVMVDKRGPVSFGPLVLGLMLAALTMISLPLTGAALNPSRVVGAYLILNNTNFLIPWILGPLVGSFAGILYDLIFLRIPKQRK